MVGEDGEADADPAALEAGRLVGQDPGAEPARLEVDAVAERSRGRGDAPALVRDDAGQQAVGEAAVLARDVALHVAEEARHVRGGDAAEDPGAARAERPHAGAVREAREALAADAPVDRVGRVVVRDGDHARERRAHRRVERVVPAQVRDEQHRLDDAGGDERALLVVAVRVAAAVDDGDGHVAGAPRRPGEGGAPGARRGHERGERREHAQLRRARVRLGAAARVHGVRDEQVAAAAQSQAAAPHALHAHRGHAAGHQPPDHAARPGRDQQVDGDRRRRPRRRRGSARRRPSRGAPSRRARPPWSGCR